MIKWEEMAVFHLKYRPLKIADLDLADVSAKFASILGNRDIPQCFLFAGPKGAGKTSAARILARAINCEDKQGVEPCGKCGNCKEILSGSSMDIMEIDAASNRGIEDVRALRDKAYLLPSKLSRKVFIVDEVHMMTKEAFNALLKLIEEPPVHTMFILCTTDAQKIPETVLSRLMRVDFRKGEKSELVKSLKRVVKGEKLEIEKEILELIAEKSDGSFRNVQKALNEMFLLFGKKLDKDLVEKYFASKGGDYTEEEFETDLKNREVRKILERMEKMADVGVDFTSFREKIISYFQKQILAVYGVGEKRKGGLGVGDMVRLINLLILASRKEKDISVDQLPMELAVIEFLGESMDGKGENKKSEEETRAAKNGVEKKQETKKVNKGLDVSIEMKEVEEAWGKVLLAVKPFNHSVEAFLRAVRPREVSGDCLVLEVFYPFHKEKLEENKNRRIVETGLKKVFGCDMGFECILSQTRKKPLIIDNNTPIEVVSDDGSLGDKQTDREMYDVAKEIFG